MKFEEIFNAIKPFASVAASFIPGGPAVVGLINAVLPDDKQLPATATGQQIMDAHSSLTPDQQSSLAEKKVDLEIKQEEGWTDRYKAMTASDGQSTRPKIALLMAWTLCLEIAAFTVWCYIYPGQMVNPVTWTVFATLTAAPAGLLGKYFGELRKEQANRLQAKQPSLLDLFKK